MNRINEKYSKERLEDQKREIEATIMSFIPINMTKRFINDISAALTTSNDIGWGDGWEKGYNSGEESIRARLRNDLGIEP